MKRRATVVAIMFMIASCSNTEPDITRAPDPEADAPDAASRVEDDSAGEATDTPEASALSVPREEVESFYWQFLTVLDLYLADPDGNIDDFAMLASTEVLAYYDGVIASNASDQILSATRWEHRARIAEITESGPTIQIRDCTLQTRADEGGRELENLVDTRVSVELREGLLTVVAVEILHPGGFEPALGFGCIPASRGERAAEAAVEATPLILRAQGTPAEPLPEALSSILTDGARLDIEADFAAVAARGLGVGTLVAPAITNSDLVVEGVSVGHDGNFGPDSAVVRVCLEFVNGAAEWTANGELERELFETGTRAEWEVTMVERSSNWLIASLGALTMGGC